MADYIYDIETYPNVFTFAVTDVDKNIQVFEISDRKRESNELRKFLGQLYSRKDRMVGFNNIGFDYPVVHYFLKNKNLKAIDLYKKANEIIKGSFDDRFTHTISETDTLIQQIDLYKIHHFDNQAKQTSLKMIEFNMRSDNISDLPFKPSSILTDEEIDVLIEYNKHDVLQTLDFYNHSLKAIRFREELSLKYNKNFLNHNDTKIGKDYFIIELEKVLPNVCYIKKGGRKVVNQTKRDKIRIKDIIFPYVKFNRPEFKAVLEWFKNQTITETKGVFTEIEEHKLGILADYCNMKQKNKKLKSKPTEFEISMMKKKNPSCWVEERPLKTGTSYYQCWRIAESLNVVVDGFEYVFGTGGIHGSIESSIVKSTDEMLIIDEDV